jgi:hypothetical protein
VLFWLPPPKVLFWLPPPKALFWFPRPNEDPGEFPKGDGDGEGLPKVDDEDP